MAANTSPHILSSIPNTRADHKVLIVVLDGVGWKSAGDHITPFILKNSAVLPGQAFGSGDAVAAAYTPRLTELMQSSLSRTLLAHGPSVGLPSADDMGNSEVGHNALGAGRVFAQGAKLVNSAIESGKLFDGSGWKKTVVRKELTAGVNTLHFCGLLSDGNVHSHIDHLFELVSASKKAGVKKVRLHVLLDGRDVGPDTGELYLEKLSVFLNQVSTPEFDCQIASGGGRMYVTMDRYESDWSIVERGYAAHVLGEARRFASAQLALQTFRSEGFKTDQNLPAFVVEHDGQAIGPVSDGDSFVLFNFRGDRAIQLTRALTETTFNCFPRKRFPKICFAGMMQYDGALKLPETYLVEPPQIDRTLTELLSASGIRQFACSETQKFGHVTYFWNGNRSGKFSEELENYVEIPSDLHSFSERPWMKSAEIADRTIEEMRRGSFRIGRINFANGDMVGHTGEFASALLSVAATDLALGRVLDAAKETNTVVLVTADHGNADEMFEVDKKTGLVQLGQDGRPRSKTSHTLAPVPFAIFNAEVLGQPVALRSDLADAGLANIAATALQLAGLIPPAEYEPSLIDPFGHVTREDKNHTVDIGAHNQLSGHPKLKNTGSLSISREQFRTALNSVYFSKIVSALRSPVGGCPWDREQDILSLRPYLIEEAYEAVQAASRYGESRKAEDAAAFSDELGDVLLQVFLNSQISAEKGHFTVADVLMNISDKMIRRHPHVFDTDSDSIGSADEVMKQWDRIKSEEAKDNAPKSLLSKAQKKNHLPTLNYLAGISKSSWNVGFAWKTLDQTFGDLTSELSELKAELFSSQMSHQRISDELGDVVLAMANLVVFLNQTILSESSPIDFDLVARASAAKFLTRFKEMETILRERGNEVTEQHAKSLSLEEWDELWREAKQRKYS
ncbi:MAG: hypothetical protein RJB13_2351 [Pseudomonadota bacterium]